MKVRKYVLGVVDEFTFSFTLQESSIFKTFQRRWKKFVRPSACAYSSSRKCFECLETGVIKVYTIFNTEYGI